MNYRPQVRFPAAPGVAQVVLFPLSVFGGYLCIFVTTSLTT
jgi:hypothetical protein